MQRILYYYVILSRQRITHDNIILIFFYKVVDYFIDFLINEIT